MCATTQKYLHECVLKSEDLKKKDITDEEVLAVMRGAFMRTDSVIMQRSKAEGWNDGCTVVAVLVLNTKFVTAQHRSSSANAPSSLSLSLYVSHERGQIF